MPLYEFYCARCHTVFNFFARQPRPDAEPVCPDCGGALRREVSVFSALCPKGGAERAAGDDGDDGLPPGFDEQRFGQALESLAGEVEHMDDSNPAAVSRLMRKFSAMTGLELNEQMETALRRMEGGEDPESIEADMGAALGEDDELPFAVKGVPRAPRRPPPRRDPQWYDL
ncbi:MAG: zinc ribbon domain-containing protein [Candidatus Marinimicrobia bacterium]|nr:zinc ribbon domain-containing protein [Candidatus Neomarinimicrobiota bacterium]